MPKWGGCGVTSACLVSAAAFLSAALASVRFLRTRHAGLAPTLANLDTCDLPLAADMRSALLRLQQHHGFSLQATLESLASAPPRATAQHAFAEQVYERARDDLLEQLPADHNAYHRARLISCGGPHAGSWLGALPVAAATTVTSASWQMALALRLGVPVKELMSGDVRCACGAVVDPYGAHYGSGCKVGNRGAAWTARHEMANDERRGPHGRSAADVMCVPRLSLIHI